MTYSLRLVNRQQIKQVSETFDDQAADRFTRRLLAKITIPDLGTFTLYVPALKPWITKAPQYA